MRRVIPLVNRTFPSASSAASKNSMIPRNRNSTPKETSAAPISVQIQTLVMEIKKRSARKLTLLVGEPHLCLSKCRKPCRQRRTDDPEASERATLLSGRSQVRGKASQGGPALALALACLPACPAATASIARAHVCGASECRIQSNTRPSVHRRGCLSLSEPSSDTLITWRRCPVQEYLPSGSERLALIATVKTRTIQVDQYQDANSRRQHHPEREEA